jgi:hypothetical protein
VHGTAGGMGELLARQGKDVGEGLHADDIGGKTNSQMVKWPNGQMFR